MKERIEAFYRFMTARECVRLNRLAGLPRSEWTSDVILQTYSFTNVKRIHDYTSSTLLREFYEPNVGPMIKGDATETQQSIDAGNVLLNCAVARFFGTVEMVRALGWSETWSDQRQEHVLSTAADRMRRGLTVFTPSYIVPNCGDPRPKHEVVVDIVAGIAEKASRIVDTHMWEVAADRLRECWGVGSFMAKEVLLDFIMAWGWQPTDWQTWTPVGPGARLGAGVVRDDELVRISERDAMDVIVETYAMREEFWPSHLVTLDLTDIQFQFCEWAKYQKAARGQGKPKRKFVPRKYNDIGRAA